tara:strand:- start:531 stop:989 length:459 start_codon:yes stop_codon:yes gene_type:complete
VAFTDDQPRSSNSRRRRERALRDKPRSSANLGSLSGRRVLVVEDEMLIAMMIEDMLKELDCVVVGPASRVSTALALVEAEKIDGAILDINLGDERGFPVAEALQSLNIPLVFATGYNVDSLGPEFANYPAIRKPFRSDQFRRILADTLLKVN